MTGWTATQTRSFLGNMPHTQSLLQRGLKGGVNSSINSMDAFYQPYSNSSSHLSNWTFPNLGPLGQSPSIQQSKLNPRQVAGQKAFRRKLTSSDASMPDYVSDPDSTSRYMEGLQQTGSHAHNSSSTMVNGDTENGLRHPQAPSNTPNTLSARRFVNDPSYNDLFANSAKTSRFPPELATSLTQSLLNQPCPLPNQAGTPMTAPGSEVKSRKETRLGASRPDSNAPSLLDHLDMRKVSQAVFGDPSDSFGQTQVYENGGNSSREASSGTSPQSSSRTFSGVFSQRSGSGSDLAKKQNHTNSFTHANVEASTPTSMGKIDDVGLLGSGKGTKRTRHLTPTGSNVDQDATRSTPRVRIGFGEAMTN